MALKLTIPTYLTFLRIIFIPLLAVLFYLPWQYSNIACTIVFIVAGITDWLDGYLARKLKMETPFGAFLDPVADKLMVAFVLVLIVQQENSLYMTLPAAIIIGREITIASLREWMAEIGQRATVKVSQLGKWKTSVQMISIGLLLFNQDFQGIPINTIGYILMYLAAILTLWSMINYLRAAINVIAND